MSSRKPTDAPSANGEDAEGEDSPQSVFGNLPQTRPGARSPRRGATTKKRARDGAAAAAPKAAAKPEAAGSQGPRPADDAARALADSEAPRDPAQGEARAPDRSQGGGLDDVAWAGVAAAAEAATIGVRLATRALEAMRDAVDRR